MVETMPGTPSDADRLLMQRVRNQRDLVAYEALVDKYLLRGLRFAQRMLETHNEAEDILQEVFLTIWQKPEHWHGRSSFSTWFYRLVFNRVVDRLRHKKRFAMLTEIQWQDMADPTANVLQKLEQQHMEQQVHAALMQLPERQRAAVHLHYFEHLPQTQAAQVLKISLTAFEGLLFRARSGMKKMLAIEASQQRTGVYDDATSR